MASLSSSFLSLKEQFLLAENGEKQQKSIGIGEVGVAQNEGRRALDFGGGEQSQSRQRADVQAGEKRTARKSSFRICKPQGTFLWPSSADMSGSGGGSSGISMEQQLPRRVEVVMADERVMLGAGDYFSTPPSASSTTNASKLLPLPSPRSPLQPQPLFTAGFTIPALHPFAGLTLRHMDSPSSPCGASLLQGGRRMAMPNVEAGGMSTELALATPSYC